MSAPRRETMVLHGLRWDTYEQLLHDVGPGRMRHTYDRGVLELMTPSGRHERRKTRLARLIETLTEVLGIPISSGGSTTQRRSDLEQALEPDECYWIQNEPRVRGREDLDPLADPPPDLAIEVDVYATSVSRMAVYAALDVPEVWRLTDDGLAILLLDTGGSYGPAEQSRAFPDLPIAALESWLDLRGRDETTWIREFRDWVSGL